MVVTVVVAEVNTHAKFIQVSALVCETLNGEPKGSPRGRVMSAAVVNVDQLTLPEKDIPRADHFSSGAERRVVGLPAIVSCGFRGGPGRP